MKTFPRLLLFCLGVLLFTWPLPAQARHKLPPLPPLATPAAEPPPLPPEPAPKISPDAPPSASLQPFLDSHLAKILAPLGTPAFAQAELIAGMKATYGDAMAAAPDTHKTALQQAQAVCDALIDAIAERQNAVAALRGAVAARSSEAAQPRGGTEAVQQAQHRDAFFLESERASWTQRATALRENMNALAVHERAVESQIGAWPRPNPTPATATPAPAAPTATAAEASAPDQDPVVGQWLLEGRSSVILAADHTITGGRHGAWRYTGDADGRRAYELHWWKPPENWADRVVLSDDGKSMEGLTRNSQHISYFRP